MNLFHCSELSCNHFLHIYVVCLCFLSVHLLTFVVYFQDRSSRTNCVVVSVCLMGL